MIVTTYSTASNMKAPHTEVQLSGQSDNYQECGHNKTVYII